MKILGRHTALCVLLLGYGKILEAQVEQIQEVRGLTVKQDLAQEVNLYGIDVDESMLHLDSVDQEVPFSLFSILSSMNLRVDAGFAQLSGEEDQMEQKFFSSSQAQISVGYPFRLWDRHMTIRPALAVGWDNYSFAQNVYLQHKKDYTVLKQATEELHYSVYQQQNERSSLPNSRSLDVVEDLPLLSSRFQNTYLGVPLEVAFFPFGSDRRYRFFVSLGGHLYYIVSSEQRIRYEIGDERYTREERTSFAVERLQYGATFRVGWRFLSLYYQMGLRQVFDDHNGPEEGRGATTFRFGIGLGRY